LHSGRGTVGLNLLLIVASAKKFPKEHLGPILRNHSVNINATSSFHLQFLEERRIKEIILKKK
jgi:hypothetical protein